MNTKSIYIIMLATILLSACSSTKQMDQEVATPIEAVQTRSEKPKNVIFLIGDGMGITQITAGLYSNGNKLELERFKDIGFHKSYAYDKLITDSAAGATAFACGIKTYNGAIGVNPDTISHKTLLEEAEERNLMTGLVATSTIVHATPASFISHNPYRKNYEEIALDFLETEIDVFIGGGKKFFYKREDQRNLYEEFTNKGYMMADFFDTDINELDLENVKRFGYLTAEDSPLPVLQGREYLLPASELSINFLNERQEHGFFIMIEGSQIDWGGHANNSEYIITEMLDFDKVIGFVLDFAEKDGNTLVIVTADHETGGYAIQKESKMDSIVGAFTTDYHTADLIPVFAYGPGSEMFRGIYENTSIYEKIRKALGWE